MSQQATEMFRMSCGASAPLELMISRPGWASGERRVFEDPFVLIGRDERSCLRLEDGEISRRHAYLQQFGERVFCVDLASRTGIRWGGEPRPAGWLQPEQGIQIGPFTLEFARTARTETNREEGSSEDGDPLQDRVVDPRFLPRVTVELAGEVQSRCCLNRALVLVGSAPACRIRLRGTAVSRFHCSLLRTPQGVWLIDLLSGSGTYLNGEWLRWTLLKEGDRFQVGPYALRVSYPEAGTDAPSPRPAMIPAQRPVPLLSHGQESFEPAGTSVPVMAPALQAELDRLRERQGDAEILRQQLADSQAECDRLREQVRAFEVQLAEAASLQTRLDAVQASVGDLEGIRGERDHWQTEARNVRDKLASTSAEREEWQKRLETVQQRLDEEGAAVRAAEARREVEVVALQKARDEFAARNGEHETALHRLQQTQEELARAQEETRRLQAEMEHALEGRQDAESLRQQLAEAGTEQDQIRARLAELEAQASTADRLEVQLRDANTEMEQFRVLLRTAESRGTEFESVRAECDRLREQVRAFEVQLVETAGLQTRLDAAQASVVDLEGIRGERDHWRTEVQSLQEKLTSTSAEREEWQKRHEMFQQRLDEEGAAVRAAEARREEEAAALQKARDELATRNAEHEAVLHRLQQTQEELARVQEETRRLQAEMEHTLEGQQDFASFRQQLADATTKQAQLHARLAELESRANAAQEECGRLTAELDAAKEERERLQTEQQTARQSAEQARVRVSDLERALTEARTAHETALTEARACWDSERQALEARLGLAGQTQRGGGEDATRDVLAQATAEREQWRQLLQGAESQLLWERGMFHEQSEQLRRQVASLLAERDGLAARLAHVEMEPKRPPAAPEPMLVQDHGSLPRQIPAQPSRSGNSDAPAEQGSPQALLTRGRGTAEQQRRLNAIAQEIQAAWGEAPPLPEGLPAISIPVGSVEEPPSEGTLHPGGGRPAEHPSALSAPPDTSHGSAPSGSSQPAADTHASLPPGKKSRPEARSRSWRQILGDMLGK